MKALSVLAVVCLVTAVGRADEKDYPKLIVGKWEVTKADEGTLPKGSIVEFTKDGKFKSFEKLGDKDVLFDGTYKVDGDHFDLDLKIGDESHKVKITITKLTADELHTKNDQGQVVEVKRKK